MIRLPIRALGLGLCGALAIFAASASAASAQDQLPDLGMAAPSAVQLQNSNGHRLLRYTAVIANVGAGPLELLGSRSNTSTTDMSVVQRIFNTSGTSRDVSIPGAAMYYAGDGHNHWHVRDLEIGTLTRLDNGVKVGTLAKHGFCFEDDVAYRLGLPGEPSSARFTGSTDCASNQPSALSAQMGLSVGWGDVYPWNIAFQYIDVTGLSPGRYRLSDGVNTALRLQELNTGNDSSWVDIQLKPNTVKVVATAP
jgi:Lysyl oxidase